MSTVRDEIGAAMERLLAGQPVHTDGRLTKTNLAAEAGVGRASLYRQRDLMRDWERRIADCGRTTPTASSDATIARLTRQLDTERRRRIESERVASGLALVVAELYRTLDAARPASDQDRPILPISTTSRRRRPR